MSIGFALKSLTHTHKKVFKSAYDVQKVWIEENFYIVGVFVKKWNVYIYFNPQFELKSSTNVKKHIF